MIYPLTIAESGCLIRDRDFVSVARGTLRDNRHLLRVGNSDAENRAGRLRLASWILVEMRGIGPLTS